MSSASDVAATRRTATVPALIALGVLGVGTFQAMPVIVAALSSRYSDQQIAQFSFVQLSSLSVGCVLALLLSRRLSIRSMAWLALILLAVCDAIAPFVGSFDIFIAVRALAGIAGGIAVSATTAALARSQTPDRAFGWFLFCQIAFQMLAVWLLPQLVAAFGPPAAFVSLATLALATLASLARYVPAEMVAQGTGQRSANGPGAWAGSAAVLISILLFFMAVGSFWTFVGRIGQENVGLSAATVGTALSLAAIGGMAGAFLPAILGARFGRIVPILAAVGALLAGLLLMRHAGSFPAYALAAAAFSLGWFLLYPFQLGVLAALDRDGRPTLLSAALTGAGLGIGPAIVGSLMHTHGLQAAYTVALSCVVGAALLILVPALAARRQ